MKKIYIAGPITALEKAGMTFEEIKSDFAETGNVLRTFDWEPVSPFDLHPIGIDWTEALRADIHGLVSCDAIYYRKGWRDSTGVKLERFIAKALNLQEKYEDPNETGVSGSQRFHQILEELGQLHDKKQRDYGSGTDPFANVRGSVAFGVPAWIGAMIRGNDKVKRIQSYIQNGSLANEGLEDSLRDLAVYAVIALVLFEEGKHGNVQGC